MGFLVWFKFKNVEQVANLKVYKYMLLNNRHKAICSKNEKAQS